MLIVDIFGSGEKRENRKTYYNSYDERKTTETKTKNENLGQGGNIKRRKQSNINAEGIKDLGKVQGYRI